MSEYYVGITIGPIIETLCLASRPASLWCASSMFSWLAEDICNRIVAKKFEVISPYYPNAKQADKYSVVAEGVGKYHDRIIFKAEADSCEKLEEDVDGIIAEAKKALVDKLVSKKLFEAVKKSKDVLTEDVLKEVILNYLQVRYIIEEKTPGSAGNVILRLSPYLDAAELSPAFKVDQSIQPIMTLFEGKDDDKHNELVKLCFGGMRNTSQIIKGGKVRDIESICKSVEGSDKKIFNYYAIVQADGDSMGKLLQALDSDELVNTFSNVCLNYTTIAADKVNAFGGMTIYAGGDDLLFICPLMNKDGKTVFQLCSDISAKFSNVFEEAFKKYNVTIPTVSFGISINYKRFPLYEALQDALGMLYTAKSVKVKEETKNKTAVHIRKGSGQSAKLRFVNGGLMQNLLNELITRQADEAVLKSMLYKIGLYRPVLITALKSGLDLEQTFINLFDSEYHGTVMEYIQKVREDLEKIYKSVKESQTKDFALENLFSKTAESDEEIALDLLYSMLRIAKFFSEKRGGKNG